MNSSTSISDSSASGLPPDAANRSAWRFVAAFLLLWPVLMLLPAVMVVVVDPYQVFHKSWLDRVFFYKDNERYQVAGLLKHYLGEGEAFDSVIVGSSISANFTSDEVEAVLGWKALNLSMRASSLPERYFILQNALATGNVKQVLFEVYSTDTQLDVEFIDANSAFPTYLYSDGILDKHRYVFNLSMVLSSLLLLEKNGWLAWLPDRVRHYFVMDAAKWSEGQLGQWSVWIEDAEKSNAFGKFNEPARLYATKQELDIAKQKQGRDQWQWRRSYPFDIQKTCLVDVIRAHPDVQFHVWFAAASLGRYAADYQMDFINQNVELRRFLIQSLAGEPNVSLFGFDNELSITADMRNYMDLSHFSRQIQSRILQEMAQGHYRLMAEDADAYAEQFRQNVLAFDIVVPEQP